MGVTIRQRLEMLERQNLAERATLSSATKGREAPVTPDDLRTEFQRDRDRILHCKSFRRLKGKTQVFLSPVGDHYRTRLTHTLEVTQVARTLARGLRLNEDLAEAIALGHDLGHTPFGHAGEDTLNRLMSCGFEHRIQSRRVVERLENEGRGLNLTWEVRDGIEHHSGPESPATPEGCCVHLADRIAYVNHDIDDAIRAGILTQDQLPAEALRVLGDTHGERINTMIVSVVEWSQDRDGIAMAPREWEALLQLRSFLFRHVYSREWAEGETRKTAHIIEELFRTYLDHPALMPNEYVEIAYKEGTERAVCDYVACMTDAFAIKRFQELFIPPFFDGMN